MSYRIVATAEGATIFCLKCGGSSSSPRDVKLRNCPSCGFHSVFPAGMMSDLTETERRLLGFGLRDRLLGADELVVEENEKAEE